MNFGLGLGLGFPLGRGGDSPSPPGPELFSFSDDFSGAADGLPVARRPGWSTISNDPRIYPVVSSQAVGQVDGYSPASLAFFGVDVGRTDGLYAEARAAVINSASYNGPCVSYYDRNNFVFFQTQGSGGRVYIQQYVGGTMTTLLDTTNKLSAPLAANDVLRLEMTSAGVTLYRNGVVYPQQSDYISGTAPTYPLAVSASLPRSGRAGFAGKVAPGAPWDDFSAGMTGATPLPRLSMGRTSRLYQRNKSTGKRAVPIGGAAAAVTGIEFRLLQNGSVVWDWGAKALTDVSIADGQWYARTPEIDAGDGYVIEVRSVDDHAAASATTPFGVGAIIVTDGQSNATNLSTGGPTAGTTAIAPAGSFAAGGAPADRGGGADAGAYRYRADIQFAEAPSSFLSGGGSAASLLYGLRAASPPVPTMVVGLGLGSTHLSEHLPSSTDKLIFGGEMTLWEGLIYEMSFLHDPTGRDTTSCDFEGFIWAQGEEDAGRSSIYSTFGAPEEAGYRAGLVTLYDALLTLTGRSAAQLPFVILGLNRAYSTTPGTDASSPGWTRFRAMQWDVCDPTSAGHIAGMTHGGCMLDIPLANAGANQPHYTAIGGAEQALRAGYAMARAKGWRSDDRRGPIPIALRRDGSDIVVTFDLQMAASLTCAASVASQFLFATSAAVDSSNLLTPANRVTPTAMTIGTPADGQCDVTFTFASAPAAGWAMQMYGGNNPQAIVGADPDALYGVHSFDAGNGVNVLTAGAFYPVVVT